jgi:uncharacterized protein (DUF362 family)
MRERRLGRRTLLRWGAGALAASTALRAGLPGTALAAEPADDDNAPLVRAGLPTAPVAIARASSYDLGLVTGRLAQLFDQLGGIGKLVNNRWVTVKVNLTGPLGGTFRGGSAGETYQIHFNLVLALADLLHSAGARQIRIVESLFDGKTADDLAADGGWDWGALQAAGGNLGFEDTHNAGSSRGYARLQVPGGGLVFPAYDVNRAYADTDVFISLGKMKDHTTTGFTLATNNNVGITPNSLYGDDAGNETAARPRNRVLHDGTADPPAGVPGELRKDTPRRADWRMPRIVVDLLAARPIDLAIVDGIETITGGEGPWVPGLLKRVSPGLLIAGRNAVCTDAVTAAVMGHNPLGRASTWPFRGDNYLALAAEAGLGSNDPDRLDVRGLSIEEARFPFNGPAY